MKLLTTLTPYQGRPQSLEVLLEALKGCASSLVDYIIIAPGQNVDHDPLLCRAINQGVRVLTPAGRFEAIGHLHNYGARVCETEWMMKLDVDCIPHVEFFVALCEFLGRMHIEGQWLNVGFVKVPRHLSLHYLTPSHMPLSVEEFQRLTQHQSPVGSQYVCRTKEYLRLGGTSEAFLGYGWEDYQVLYMLESHRMGRGAFFRIPTLQEVTQRVRDEISRPLCRATWQMDSRLCLLHKHHGPSLVADYNGHLEANRQVLFDFIRKWHILPSV